MRDPLSAIPLRPPDLEVRQDSQGHVHLRRQGRVNWLQRLMRQEYSRKVSLDEFGSLYYGLIDGRRTLREIVDALVEKSGRERKEVEEGVVVFTKQLMVKHLLRLQVAA